MSRMRQRLDAVAWLQAQERRHGAFVPIMTAARVLGVERRRVAELIEQRRLTCIEGMPGGGKGDRFVPVSELVNAPFREEVGRRGVFGVSERKKYTAPRRLWQEP